MFYRIVPSHPESHLFTVTCTVKKPQPQGQRVSLPSWIPGSYMLRDFAKNIVEIRASSQGRTLTTERLDKSTWLVEPCSTELVLSYDVYAWDLSVRSAYLDTFRGYFNGTSVFVKVEGFESEQCLVEIVRPDGERYQPWRVATTLAPVDAEPWGFGLYQADSYDDLIDHPVEMGQFDVGSFDVQGVTHNLVFVGRQKGDIERICRDLKPICQTHIDMFGGLPQELDRYLFMTTVVGEGYGGLEHRSSTSLVCSRADLPTKDEEVLFPEYLSFLGLCSHEYFHLWNVKRIKPDCFVPYDLEREAYTRQLWAFEGITSYYDDLGLVRSGVIEPQRYLDLLGQTITRVVRGKGRFKQSVSDSSFDAWTKFYRQDENAPNAIVSYYTKGSLIALALDLTIREKTGDKRSLDDLMRRLWQEYGQPQIGVPEGRIEEMAAEVAGCDLDDFFQRYLHGKEDPPLDELLASVGVEFRLRPAESLTDKGGTKSRKPIETLLKRPDLGVRISAENGQAKLANVFDDGAAQQAGLSAGDVLVAIDGLKVTAGNLEKVLQHIGVGQTVPVHLFRRDELLCFDVVMQPPPCDTCELILLEYVSEEIARRRAAWLGG